MYNNYTSVDIYRVLSMGSCNHLCGCNSVSKKVVEEKMWELCKRGCWVITHDIHASSSSTWPIYHSPPPPFMMMMMTSTRHQGPVPLHIPMRAVTTSPDVEGEEECVARNTRPTRQLKFLGLSQKFMFDFFYKLRLGFKTLWTAFFGS